MADSGASFVIIWSPIMLSVLSALAGLVIGVVVARWWALALTAALWGAATVLAAGATSDLLLWAQALAGFLLVGLVFAALGIAAMRRRGRPLIARSPSPATRGSRSP